MKGKTVITITEVRSGQPRPYADSEYVAEIEKQAIDYNTGELKPYPLAEDEARALTRLFVRAFEDEPKEWWRSRLHSLSVVTPYDDRFGLRDGKKRALKWRAHVVQPFTD